VADLRGSVFLDSNNFLDPVAVFLKKGTKRVTVVVGAKDLSNETYEPLQGSIEVEQCVCSSESRRCFS
jgi:hypothetical protein